MATIFLLHSDGEYFFQSPFPAYFFETFGILPNDKRNWGQKIHLPLGNKSKYNRKCVRNKRDYGNGIVPIHPLIFIFDRNSRFYAGSKWDQERWKIFLQTQQHIFIWKDDIYLLMFTNFQETPSSPSARMMKWFCRSNIL